MDENSPNLVTLFVIKMKTVAQIPPDRDCLQDKVD
jgi:hypothetical protein